MFRYFFFLFVLVVSGCGKVPETADASIDASSDPDGALACSGDPACDDALACNGAETCVDGACAPGVALDCGTSDACATRGCDDATGCTEAIVEHAITFSVLDGPSGTVAIACDANATVYSVPCGTGNVVHRCDISAGGLLQARIQGSMPGCPPLTTGIEVATGCTTAINGARQLTCCFR
jgi:hypothetical protein